MGFWKKLKKGAKRALKVFGMFGDPKATHGVGVPGESDALGKAKGKKQ